MKISFFVQEVSNCNENVTDTTGSALGNTFMGTLNFI